MRAGKSSLKRAFIWLSFVLIASMLLGCHRNHRLRGSQQHVRNDVERQREERNSRSVVPLQKKNGVLYIKIKVNDVPMQFIFDTGASSISISETEAQFLYKQGTLDDDDFLGKARFQDAQGDVSEGYIINLKKIEIGNRVLKNVEASIVPNQSAPLLLGQSLLQRIGRFSIDNEHNQLIIE